MKHSVVVVDDHILLSQAIGDLINSFNNFENLFSCKNGQELLTQLKANNKKPDIVLMDVNMPILNGIETTKILSKEFPNIKVIALSMEEDNETILKMLRAGAKGYLIKDTKKEILEEALLETIKSGFYYTNTVSKLLIGNLNKPNQDFELKEREIEFIQYACSEMTYKEIADKMFLSPKTIDNYRDAVFNKLNVKNRVGLVLYAIRHNLFKT